MIELWEPMSELELAPLPPSGKVNTGTLQTTRSPGGTSASVRYTTTFICSALSVMATYLPSPRIVGDVPEPSSYCPGRSTPMVSYGSDHTTYGWSSAPASTRYIFFVVTT